MPLCTISENSFLCLHPNGSRSRCEWQKGMLNHGKNREVNAWRVPVEGGDIGRITLCVLGEGWAKSLTYTNGFISSPWKVIYLQFEGVGLNLRSSCTMNGVWQSFCKVHVRYVYVRFLFKGSRDNDALWIVL